MLREKKKAEEAGRRTAREVLAKFGGEAHAEHSVARKEPSRLVASDLGFTRGFLIDCSCGYRFAVAATPENLEALRNVPEGRPS